MKNTLLLFFLLSNIFSYSQSQETIYVTELAGNGPGSLYDAITKANASSAASGRIEFSFNWFGSLPPLTLTYYTSPLPALTKDNWTISKYAQIILSNPDPFNPWINSTEVLIYGENQGPGIVLTGNNSVNEITLSNTLGFKPTKYIVSNTNDSGPGSLRFALQCAMSTNAKDTIAFNIPGTPPHTINLNSALPTIVKGLVIDGSTQATFLDGKETVVLSGNNQFNGLTLYGCSGTEIYGLTIKNCSNGIGTIQQLFPGDSPEISSITIGKKGKGNILISNNGVYPNGNGIQMNVSRTKNISICNNYIGTNIDGDQTLGNRVDGLSLTGDCFISENIISGNGGSGITCAALELIVNNGMNYTISGRITRNKIGTDVSGKVAIPNKGSGIELRNGSATIGGNLPTDGNIISGNLANGINFIVGYGYVLNIARGSVKHYIYNNQIGTDSSGQNPLPNGKNGIATDSYNYGMYYIGDNGKGNTIAYNKEAALATGNASVLKQNSIFNNASAVRQSTLAAPVINSRSSNQISGSAPNGTIVQLFYDNGFNSNAQGKEFIAEVYPSSGVWEYNGSIAKPCSVTAVAIDTVNKISSTFSLGGTFSLGQDITLCQGDSAVLDAQAGFSNYQWSTGESTRAIKVKQAGKFIVQAANGCMYTDTIEINYRAKPIVNLGRDTSICSGASYSLDAGNPGASYVWNRTGSLQTLYITESGTYIAKVSFDRCSNSDTVSVNILNTPIASTGKDIYLCQKDSAVLNANLISDNGNQYLWSTGETLKSIKVKTSGIYSVKVFNKCFAPAYDTIKISLDPLVVNLGNDTTICTGNSLVLKAGNPGSFQKWYNKDYFLNKDTMRTVTAAGKYFVAVNSGSCTASDTIVVTKANTSVNLGSDSYLCNGDSITLDAGTNASHYLWASGSTERYLKVKTGGKYYVKVSYNGACAAYDTISFTTTECNAISGSMYIDNDASCTKNTGEESMMGKFIILKNISNGQTYYASTDSFGNYFGKYPLGTYNVSPAPAKKYAAICPATPYLISLNNGPESYGKNFGITLNTTMDLAAMLGGATRIRPGTDYSFGITYSNHGFLGESGKVYLIKDPFINITSFSRPYSQMHGDTLIWEFSDLSPNETRTISFTINVSISNLNLVGSYLLNKVIVEPGGGTDVNDGNNTSEIRSLITYAVDPNDKLSDKGTDRTITVNDSIIHYTINFLNIGNDTAHTVVIRDTLSAYVDIPTLESGAGSHPYSMSLSGKGVVTWTFKNILLPDSTTDPKRSSGYINYSIKLKKGLALGTVVSNNASIYFDLAPPVITNTTRHTIVDHLSEQTISFPSISNKEYLDQPFELDISSSSELPLNYAWTGPISIENGKVAILGTGAVRVRAYQVGDDLHYPSSFNDRVFTIRKSNQSIVFDSISPKKSSDPSFVLTSQGGLSSNPVLYSIVSGPALIDGNQVALTGEPGLVTVKASQPGNENFNDAEDVVKTFLVSQTTGIEPYQAKLFAIYPNPAGEKIQLLIKDEKGATIEFISSYGATIKTESFNSDNIIIDISKLESGLYTIVVNCGTRKEIQRLIITR